MADRTELTFRRAAARWIPPGSVVLAAVSGGGDSVALAHLLHRLAAGGRIELVMAHLDHGLRRGSRADRRFVEELARELGLTCVADRREVASLRRRRESPEEAARRVRRTFLLEAAKQVGADRIATGHTLDDQAETVLMRLARGAGPTALAGMSPSGPLPFVRPLLEIERRSLRTFLRRHDLPHREDPSNRDLRYDRNRVRRLVLPVLEEQLNPRAAHHLVKAARLIRADAEYLDEVAEEAFASIARPARLGLVVDAHALAASPPVIRTRVARLVLLHAGSDPRRVGTAQVEALVDLATGPGGRRLDLPGVGARRVGAKIHVTRNRER